MNIKEVIEPIFENFEKELFSKKYEVEYLFKNDDNWSGNLEKIKELLINVKGNIYCIFIKNENERIIPVYVGECESKKIKQRLRQHLFFTSEGTSSKLNDVKKIIRSNGKVFINTVFIEPEYMRAALEKMIIDKNKKKLIWNLRKK